MGRRVLLLILVSLSFVLNAGEIENASVKHRDGVYTLKLSVIVAAESGGLYDIMSDYDALHRISEVLLETRLLPTEEEEQLRRLLVARTCVLVFCFTARMVEEVKEHGQVITTRIIPEESDYKSGETEWRVTALTEGRSQFDFTASWNRPSGFRLLSVPI